MKKYGLVAWAVAATILAVYAGASSPKAKTVTVTKTRTVGAQKLYIRNLAPRYISDATIRKDIPAWEKAVNVDFASYWKTTQYKLIFIGRKPAPVGEMSAVFISKGPVEGALAYHWLGGNAPAITVYAGTGDYYGYDNSISFDHELKELAADPVTSYLNIGYPSSYYWLEKKDTSLKAEYSGAIGWMSEVCDPVEADFYTRPGADGKPVRLSDFVTPAWFNDGVGTRYDFMGVTQQPFWIRPGGYAIYLDASGFNAVTNFRKGVKTDPGFYVADDD